jgi:hypothetical protein
MARRAGRTPDVVSSRIDLGALDLTTGAGTVLRRALRTAGAGDRFVVLGNATDLELHLDAFARAEGHTVERRGAELQLVSGGHQAARRTGAERAGSFADEDDGSVVERPPATWGLAARGALVERGGPAFAFGLDDKRGVWADEAQHLYRSAAASQWDPETAIPWSSFVAPRDEVEDAVVQVMTYLVENETAALVVPARFAGRIHPHFREVMLLLAIQAADEARHIEVFGRRAALSGRPLGLSTVSGQTSLKTLLDEPTLPLASFLLSVLGEGTFLSLLRFLEAHAPDDVTRAVVGLAAQDEARHVAFGVAHLRRHAQLEPTLLARLAAAVEHRHDALAGTSGLNDEVFDALVVIGGGGAEVARIEAGHRAVQLLLADMQAGRTKRLVAIGFDADEAARLSSLHTRNFM